MTLAEVSRGAVHVAYGPRYISEAAISAASVRATNPEIRLGLLTDKIPDQAHLWDEIWLAPNDEHRGGSKMKLQMHRAPWDQCLFLDTDTLIVGDLSPVFSVLDRFEFAGVQHSGGLHYSLPGLPSSFLEFNSGVLAWRREPRVLALFERWNTLYDELADQPGRVWDQKSLRLALYESDLRIACLPHGFNVMPYFPAIIEGEAVVIHGRNHAHLERLRDRLGKDCRLRAYIPGLGVMRHPKELTWRKTLNMAARLVAWRMRASDCGVLAKKSLIPHGNPFRL